MGAALLLRAVAKRPSLQVTAPAFGAWLRDRRKSRSLEGLAQRLRPLLPSQQVTTSTLAKLEKGRVPNWPMLLALAEVYDVSVMDMLTQLAKTIDFPGRDLIGQGGTGNSAPTHPGGADSDPASTREVRELREQLAHHEKLAKVAEKAVSILGKAVADLEAASPNWKGRTAHRPERPGHGSRKRAG